MKKLDVFSQWNAINFDLIKADDNEKKSYIIEGIASTENIDTSGETILQDGLDWSYCLKNGCFNYDHQNDAASILGAPQEIKKTYVEGKKATMIKGVLYGTKKIVKDLIENVNAMKAAGSPRQLGFSIEGQVIARDPRNPKIITKAKVLNCAITHTPCNTDAVVSMVKNVLGQIAIQKAYPNEIAIRLQNPNDYSYFRRVDVPDNHHWSKKFGSGKVSYVYGMDKKTKTLEIQAIRIRVDQPNEYSQKEIMDYLKQRNLNYIKVEMPTEYKEKGFKMKKDEIMEPQSEEMDDTSMSEENMDEELDKEYADLYTTQQYADLCYQYSMSMKKLLDVLPKDTDLPEWVQAKIIIAADYMQSVYHYSQKEIKDKLDEMSQGWGEYKKILDTETAPQIAIDPSKFEDGNDYQTNDKPYGQVVIVKEEGSMAPIVPQSLEGVEDKLMESEDYQLSADELKILIQRLVTDYPQFSNDKIIALIAKIMKK